MEPMLIPPWLESLLSTAFFYVCPSHKDAPRSECNMFCLDCRHGSFCFYCRSNEHEDHQVIQIRRSSYHNVVRVSEMEKVLDISEVQTYVINSARVLFLNERPQPKSSATKGGGPAGSPHVCEICSRSLLDPFRFCSLGCKVVGIKKNGKGRFSSRRRKEVLGRRMASKEEEEEEEEELGEGRKEEAQICHHHHTHPSHSNSRRRKGIPHRAPF